MADNFIYGIGFMAGLLGAMLIGLIIVLTKIHKKKHTQFDERQVLARGTAYKVSFFVAIFYMLACFLVELFELRWAIFTVQMIIGVFITCAVFAIMCIFTNAYFGVNQKNSVAYIEVLASIGLMNTFIGINNLSDWGLPFTDGALNLNSINFIAAIFLFIIDIALIIKVILEKRASVEE
ncbi:MAG: hypothetical protein J1E96_06275 [Ruminococcus sp.]|nr:hypothetical protein [Ruminococcus sp.]